MPGVLAVFDLDEAPHYSSFCRWEQEYRICELRRLLRTSVEQAGWSGHAAIDASGFQRDQTSHHYRNRAGYSFQSLKTTVLIDVNSQRSKTSTTQLGRVGMDASGCRSSAGTRKTYRCWRLMRTIRGATSVRSAAPPQHVHSSSTKEHTPLKKAHNARMDNDAYHQRWMSDGLLAVEGRRREATLPELARPVPEADTEVHHT